ncbi:MAG: SET domain-containing protein [bacterium]
MQRDDNLFSVEDRGDDETYFINHSCDGNLRMKDAFTLIARTDINKDEEITADYALWE